MKKYSVFSAVFIILLLMPALLSGCAEQRMGASEDSSASEISSVGSNAVAEGSETVPDGLIIPEDMVPVFGDCLKDGEYDIKADSSSSMFTVTDCRLTVNNGKMTARMTMGGTGYLYVFMGKGADASDDMVIPFEEAADGTHSFTVPVEALDMGIDCAAFSKKKEKWYDRTLLFRSDSLPLEAFADGSFITPESLGLEDGEYSADVSLEGGSGRAVVSSPAKLIVQNGELTAEIIWGSSNYDCMTVDGVKYYPVNDDGNSTFIIPVAGFDRRLPVSANTTAMSTPHEIEYTLFFDSKTICRQ